MVFPCRHRAFAIFSCSEPRRQETMDKTTGVALSPVNVMVMMAVFVFLWQSDIICRKESAACESGTLVLI